MIPAGELRDRVQLQRRIGTADAEWGTVAESWQTYATVWASVRPMRAAELLADNGVLHETVHTVRIRHRADVTPEHRLIYRGRALDIAGVVDVDGRRAVLELRCVEHREKAA
jgi:SPP1 family predicted phage head-tail adaptor